MRSFCSQSPVSHVDRPPRARCLVAPKEMIPEVQKLQELQEFRSKMISERMVPAVNFAGFVILQLLNSCNS